jgi:hypothetical protein
MFTHGLLEEPLGSCHITICRQEKIYGFSFLADSTVEILPDALDFDVRLVRSPAGANLAFMFV